MLRYSKKLINEIKNKDWTEGLDLQDNFWEQMSEWINDRLLPEVLAQFTLLVDEIIEIDSDLSEIKILQLVATHMVDNLNALFASVRIYDPDTEQMLSFGSYPSDEKSREIYIPLEGSISGEVVKTGRVFTVSNISKEKLYLDKTIIARRGANSLIAVPLEIPRFFPNDRDTSGVIQIYFPEEDRVFTSLEILTAGIMSRRFSFVIARKKIMSMYKVNEKKDAILEKIFLKLGSWEGVKMKDVFNRIISELADIINIQSCALFSVSNDMEHVVLDAGYPDSIEYHGIGKRFRIDSEPAFELVLNLRDYAEETTHEIVSTSYILVKDPRQSPIISKTVKKFAASHNVNSILYIPLKSGEEITHFMTFDAIDQRKSYTPEEIEIFLFLGYELTKAQKLERLDDILHDFKNPAIAIAGFARRLKKLLEDEAVCKDDSTIKKYTDILFKETSRIQEMAMSISQVGRETVVNLTQMVKDRFEINTEVIKEQFKQNVTLEEGPFEDPLYMKCYPIQLERLLDNILNNATKAIPAKGGSLSVRTYEKSGWACFEVTNTGEISEEDRIRILEGTTRGRGASITHRIIRLLKGKLDVRAGNKTTTVIAKFHIHRK